MPSVSSMRPAMAAPTCARAGSQLGTDHAPLYLIFLCTELEAERASIVGRAVIHGSSSS